MKSIKILFVLFSILHSYTAFCQNITVELGKSVISTKEYFTISIKAENTKVDSYGDFPEIEGLIKQGITQSQGYSNINGQISSSHTITQNYLPSKPGEITTPAFKIEVNGQIVSAASKTIKVVPAQPQQQRDPYSFFDFNNPFFDGDYGMREEPEYVEVKDDAFFALTTNKKSTYVGEGVTVTIAFYVSEENLAKLNFYKNDEQLSKILKEIKMEDCWVEEHSNTGRIESKTVTINQKKYQQYTLYQATYFPITDEDLVFPALQLDMVKYDVAKKRTFFGAQMKGNIKPYYSSRKRVKVKELPPHPLRDGMPVGNYTLKESINKEELETGKSYNYSFSVRGEGNISAIKEPLFSDEKYIFEIYPPNIKQNIITSNNRVGGSKTFDYYIVPNDTGRYDLGDFIQLIYFNPYKHKYDTLKSEIHVNIAGKSMIGQKESFLRSGAEAFYDLIDVEKNSLQSVKAPNRKKAVNIISVFLFLIISFLLFLRYQEPIQEFLYNKNILKRKPKF